MNFGQLQTEVSRKASRGDTTQATDVIKNAINGAILKIAREAYWRVLRRKTTFDTITSYTTGSGAATYTNGSPNVTVTGATFYTDGIRIGRLIELGGDSNHYTIKEITGETTLVLDRNFTGTTASGDGTYEILPQEEYVLPLQVTHRCFLWHEDYGYPYQMEYVVDQKFWSYNIDRNQEQTPQAYRMWQGDMVLDQVKTASTISGSSSSANDTSVSCTIYGDVSGYPDQEDLTITGTSEVTTTKSFSNVDRISVNGSRVGRLTFTANSGNTTVSVIPSGDGTDQIIYTKVQLWPLPDAVFPINVYYYEDPYKLVNDNDVHQLGAQFDRAIIFHAVADLKLEEGQVEGNSFFQLYREEIDSLKKTNVDKIDFLNVLRSGARGRSTPMAAPFLSFRQIGNGNYGPRA